MPEIRFAIAQHIGCSSALLAPHAGVAKQCAVCQDDHLYGYTSLYMAGYGTAAAKNLIVRMWRKYQDRLCGHAQAGGIGDQVRFQGE